MLGSTCWQSESAVDDRAKMFVSSLTLGSLFIEQILNFFYQNDQKRVL
jgi:hypothetical protein